MMKNHATATGSDRTPCRSRELVAMPRVPHWLSMALASVLLVVVMSGEASAQPNDDKDYVLFLDVSVSITQRQRDLWADMIRSQVLTAVMPGNSLTIFLMHGNTSSAAPLFHVVLPPSSLAETPAGRIRLRHAIEKMRFDSNAAVVSALTQNVHAQCTDILGAFDRIRVDGDTRTEIVIVASDMINSTNQLDLEKQSIGPGQIPALVDRIAKNHRWTAGTARGAQIHCLLNDVSQDDAAPRNSRIVLREFWTALAQAVGGELVTFETHLDRNSFFRRQS